MCGIVELYKSEISSLNLVNIIAKRNEQFLTPTPPLNHTAKHEKLFKGCQVAQIYTMLIMFGLNLLNKLIFNDV